MKRAGILLVMLAMAGYVSAEQYSGQNPPAAQPGAGQTPAPGAGQNGNPQQPGTAPAGKRPPQAKTQAELDAFKAAAAITDPAGFEKAADDFATKFPDSELRVRLFRNGMQLYQSANNGDKMLEMGRKVIKIDPDDPVALIGVAQVLAERTRDTDLDKEQRLDESMKDAQHVLQTVDTDLEVNPGTPQEKVDAYKNFLRSDAYSIMGTLSYNQEKYADAENYLRKSIDAFPQQPDPIAVLRLALALDKQGKYADALKEATRAVDLTQENTNAGTLARRERDRLQQLTGGGVAPAAKPPAPSAPQTTPPKN